MKKNLGKEKIVKGCAGVVACLMIFGGGCEPFPCFGARCCRRAGYYGTGADLWTLSKQRGRLRGGYYNTKDRGLLDKELEEKSTANLRKMQMRLSPHMNRM